MLGFPDEHAHPRNHALELPLRGPDRRLKTWRERLDIDAALAGSGWTGLFAALSVVANRAENAELRLDSFAGRIVSLPTILGVDIGARTALFATSVVLFVLLFGAFLALLHQLRKLLPAQTGGLLEALSLGGLALWVARAYTLEVHGLIWLVVALQVAGLVIGLVDRVVFRAGEHPEGAAYFTSLCLLAVGCIFAASDWRRQCVPAETPWMNWGVGACVVGLHLVLRVVCWRADRDRRRAALVSLMAGLSPAAACLPLVSMLHEELYLTINNRGYTSVRPAQVQLLLVAGLAAWGVLRYLRSARAGAPPMLERSLLRAGLPLFAFGLAAYARYVPIILGPSDLFEPANPGLEVQQWAEFGRLPWIETFNAHGFSDSLWEFLYCLIQGFHHRTLHFYLFLDDALATLLIYHALRRVSGNGYLAFFCAVLFPFRPALIPAYSALALTSVFVLEWIIARPNLRCWTLFGFYCVACILWRLDIGFAHIVASAATLAAVWYLRAGVRPRPRVVLLAGAICAFVCAGGFVVLCLARGVDPWLRLLDLRHIVNSSQSSGYPTIAGTYDPTVFWHLGVFPIAVLAVLGWVLATQRSASTLVRPGFLVLLLVYGGVYYFANYQRGLVRHTFWEPGNAYLLSFGFLVLSIAPYLWSRLLSPKAQSAIFLGVACLLGGSFGLMGPLPAEKASFTNGWQRAIARRVTTLPTAYSVGHIERSPMDIYVFVHHYDAICGFVRRMLSPQQTFLDLTNSPVLYIETHRRSPHYVNHLRVVHDEWLQKRQLEEFERQDVPFVLVWQEQDLAALDGVSAPAFNTADGVANNLRDYRFHEWLNARYEPWCVVQRWQVWRRLDWLAPAPPAEADVRELAAQRGALPQGGRVVLTPQASDHQERQVFLELRGSAASDGELRVRIRAAGSEVERTLALHAGTGPWYWSLPVEFLGRELASIELDFARAPGFALSEACVRDAPAPAYTMIAGRLHPQSRHVLGRLPWLWANADEQRAIAQPVLKTIYEPAGAGLRALKLDAHSGPGFDRGVSRQGASFRLADERDAQGLKIGDRLRFAQGGERVVLSIEGTRVSVSGEPLDPLGDGAPQLAQQVPAADPSLASVLRMNFEPLEDPKRPCYVAVRLRAQQPVGTHAAITWGADERTLGRFEFDVLGPGPQDYLMRISSQSSWALSRCNWLSFEKLDSDAQLLGVKLLEGD